MGYEACQVSVVDGFPQQRAGLPCASGCGIAITTMTTKTSRRAAEVM